MLSQKRWLRHGKVSPWSVAGCVCSGRPVCTMLRLPSVSLLLVLWVQSGWTEAWRAPSWTYLHQGKWSEQFPQCGGSHQSPVNLISNLSEPLQATTELKMRPKNLRSSTVKATNTGRMLKLNIKTSYYTALTLESGPLKARYQLDHILLHWSDHTGWRGSDHQIEGSPADAEAQFIFFKEQYGNSLESLNYPDGLAALGILLNPKTSEDDLLLPSFSLTDQLKSLSSAGSSLVKTNVDLRSLKRPLRKAIGSYFTYNGSLTAPPCSPVVTWIVPREPVAIEPDFLAGLRQLKDENGKNIRHNFRKVEKLQNRTIHMKNGD